MGLRTRRPSGYTDVYVRFYGTSVAVAAPEGSGLDAGWYAPTDVAIAAAGLPAGNYDGEFSRGNPASPTATDAEEALFFDFAWNGSATITNSLTQQNVRDAMKLAASAGSPANGSIDDKLNDVEGGGIVIPVNQIPVPRSRMWRAKPTSNGLEGELPLRHRAGTNQVFGVDFNADLPNNGRLVSLDAVTLVSGTEGGIVISFEEPDGGVDRSEAKFRINLVTAGTYVFDVQVSYEQGDGGGTSIARVTLIVR